MIGYVQSDLSESNRTKLAATSRGSLMMLSCKLAGKKWGQIATLLVQKSKVGIFRE
jgi:hypothetical protein